MLKTKSKHLITIFLPCNTSLVTKILTTKVNEYSFLITNLLKVIEFLHKKEIDKFDALVGDNACHVCALKICTSFSSCLTSFLCNYSKIESVKKEIDYLIIRNEIPIRGSLDDFLVKHNLNIELSEDELFMLGCYFLTIVKKELPSKMDRPLCINKNTAPLALKNLDRNVSGQFLRNLVDRLRKYIASSSVDYMGQQASLISCKEIASKMVSADYTILHNNLKCMSIFWSTLIVMERALQLGLPIILIADQKASDYDYQIVNKASFLLKLTDNNYYSLVNPKTENINQLGIVIKGTTCRPLLELSSKKDWIEELISYQPIELFLAYSATHRQFPDSTKDQLITSFFDPKFEEYRQKSIKWGCCLDNPSLFFISHVYCQKIGNISDLLNPAEVFGNNHRKLLLRGMGRKEQKNKCLQC